jgi:hypothetical protein
MTRDEKTPSIPPRGSRLRAWLLRAAVPALGAAVLLGVAVALGRVAREHLRDRDRYTINFTDVECRPPEGADRAAFLAEVQYLAGSPDRLHVLDDDLAARLAHDFALHPWVEAVRGVEVAAGPVVRVELAFRRPVLLISRPENARGYSEGVVLEGGVRALPVDRSGVVLPSLPKIARALLLDGDDVPGPSGSRGAPWGDPRVEAAACLADFLEPELDRLHVRRCKVRESCLVLFTANDDEVLWGSAPGREPSGEAPAALKRERLRAYTQKAESQPHARQEYDLRPLDEPVVRRFLGADPP